MLVRGVEWEVKPGQCPDKTGTLCPRADLGPTSLSLRSVTVTEPESLASPSSSSLTFLKAMFWWESGQRGPPEPAAVGFGMVRPLSPGVTVKQGWRLQIGIHRPGSLRNGVDPTECPSPGDAADEEYR